MLAILCRIRRSDGLFFLGCLLLVCGGATAAMELSAWRAIGSQRLDECRVGACAENSVNKCCYHAQKLTCVELAEFSCTNNPTCTAGFQKSEKCNTDALCNTGAEGDRCNKDLSTLTANRCTATGRSIATDCQGTQQRCEFNTTNTTIVGCVCTSGYTACTGNPPQYLNKCML